MTKTLIPSLRYRHTLQSILCLLDQAHELLEGAQSDGTTIVINLEALEALCTMSGRITDQIAGLADPRLLDRQPTATPTVYKSSESPCCGGAGILPADSASPSTIPVHSLSTESAPAIGPDHSQHTGGEHAAGELSPRRS
jgi:hypothetical protein